MKPSQSRRKASLPWQKSQLLWLLTAQKSGTLTDNQSVRMKSLVVSVANLQRKKKP